MKSVGGLFFPSQFLDCLEVIHELLAIFPNKSVDFYTTEMRAKTEAKTCFEKIKEMAKLIA